MSNEESRQILKGISDITNKLDNLHQMLAILSNDVGVQRGMHTSDQLVLIQEQLKILARELNSDQLRSIPVRMNDVARSIEYINHKIR